MSDMLDTVPQPLLPAEATSDEDSAKPACANLQGIARRGLAFSLDTIPFAIVAGLLVHFFPGAVVDAYPWSRLAAVALLVLFRAAFQAAAGQTPGQRLLGLRVAGKYGRAPTFGVALARNTLAVLPMVLNGFSPPGLAVSLPFGLAGTLTVFGGGLGATYLLFFNRATRQSLHDLVTGTFVWYGPGSVASPPSAPFPGLHVAVLTVLALAFTAIPVVAFQLFAPEATQPSLVALRRDVLATGHYQDVRVATSTRTTPGETQRTLMVGVQGRFDQALLDAQTRDITSLVRAHRAELPPADRLVVRRVESYDLFFAWGTRSESKEVTLDSEPR